MPTKRKYQTDDKDYEIDNCRKAYINPNTRKRYKTKNYEQFPNEFIFYKEYAKNTSFISFKIKIKTNKNCTQMEDKNIYSTVVKKLIEYNLIPEKDKHQIKQGDHRKDYKSYEEQVYRKYIFLLQGDKIVIKNNLKNMVDFVNSKNTELNCQLNEKEYSKEEKSYFETILKNNDTDIQEPAANEMELFQLFLLRVKEKEEKKEFPSATPNLNPIINNIKEANNNKLQTER